MQTFQHVVYQFVPKHYNHCLRHAVVLMKSTHLQLFLRHMFTLNHFCLKLLFLFRNLVLQNLNSNWYMWNNAMPPAHWANWYCLQMKTITATFSYCLLYQESFIITNVFQNIQTRCKRDRLNTAPLSQLILPVCIL